MCVIIGFDYLMSTLIYLIWVLAGSNFLGVGITVRLRVWACEIGYCRM